MDCPPNILWICTEHQRHDTIGALTNPYIRTPHLDRLTAEGVTFTHAFAQSPVCMPSRASFMTGCYPAVTGVPANGYDIHDDQTLVTADLARRGYDAALAGKLHVRHAYDGEERRGDDGYHMFHWSHGTVPGAGGEWERWLKRHGYEVGDVYQDSGVLNSRRVNDRRWHQTTWCFDRAREFIDRPRDGPWLMSIHPFAAHDPYDYLDEFFKHYDPHLLPAPRFRRAEQQGQPKAALARFPASGFDQRGFDQTSERERQEMVAAYYATIEHIDHEIGNLLDHLTRTGQREHTLIVFMADHGDLLGDHGLFAKGPLFYEPLVRVPLIFSWLGHIREGMRVADLVELVDVVPTIYELLGEEPPGQVQGRSLVGLMRGERDASPHREGVFAQHYDERSEEGRSLTELATMWRTRRHKIVIRHGEDRGELYDLEVDPDEFDNIWDDPAAGPLREGLRGECFDALARTMHQPVRKKAPY